MSKLTKDNLNRFVESLDLGIESCNEQERILLRKLDVCYADRKMYINERILALKLIKAADILSKSSNED